MTDDPYEYSTLILGVLFIVSEVLPFIKKNKGNGVCDSIVCILKGSSCVALKIVENIESKEEDII